MIKTEFGIIEQIDFEKDYSESYEPESYDCIAIDDDLYITDWWDKLILLKTYFHCMSRPDFSLARWGITIIPPESLPAFQQIVLEDYRINTDNNLVLLADKIQKAIKENKHMIHYGV